MLVVSHLGFTTKIGKQWIESGENEIADNLSTHPDFKAFVANKDFTVMNVKHTDSSDIKAPKAPSVAQVSSETNVDQVSGETKATKKPTKKKKK